jgi:FlaA1/EpsC-like NDP-sugar epimerase
VLKQQNTALLIAEPGEPRRIEELAQFVMAQSGTDMPIVFTELRPGDKLHERMTSDCESRIECSHGILQSVRSPIATKNALQQTLQKITESIRERDLEGLLQAICSVVPEYHPGAWLQSQAASSGRELR